MAYYRITHEGFPVGQWLIPNGVEIDDVAGTDQWSVLARERGLVPPVTASPLDTATYNQMVQLYGSWRVGPPPGGADVI
jgi:hypothetical protein